MMPCFFYYILLLSFLYNANSTYRLDNHISSVKYCYLETLLIELRINVNKILPFELNINIDKNLSILLYITISSFT